jgi:hypothetical protein
MLMRTALWHVRLARHAEMCSTLYGTCHHAVRRVQRARPAHAAFSAVSCAVCSRSSAVPGGSLSNVLGDSTAAPKGEIVPRWEAASGNGALECGKVETGESGTEGLSGIPSLRARERACDWKLGGTNAEGAEACTAGALLIISSCRRLQTQNGPCTPRRGAECWGGGGGGGGRAGRGC